MESFNINQSKLEDYSEKFAQKACDSFFSMFKSTVIGSEIMKITPVDQVNYFVLFNLFETWKQEVAKLESPYFDYSKPEVKEALRNFMNTVSMHINLKREDFEPLLQKSVTYTINLTLYPKLFFEIFFNNLPDKISIEQIISYEKYFKINKGLYSETLERIKSNYQEEVPKNQLLNAFSEIAANYKETEKTKDSIIQTLNAVVPLSIDDFMIQITSSVDIQAEEMPPIKEPVIKSEPQELVETQISDLKKDSFKNNQGLLNNKVVDVKSAMTINQRFMFVEQLFKGEKWEFDNALSRLENCTDYDSAIKMLLSDYAMKYEWDTENEQVSELFDFIGKKYSN